MIDSKPWLLPAALLIVCAGFVLLGRWQLERAEVNRRIEQQFTESASLPAVQVPLADIRVDEYRFRRMEVTGRYRPDIQVLLDNMTRDGIAGYEVLTPFSVDSSDRVILVNRGWVPASWDRSQLPDVEVSSDMAAISGRIDRLPRAGFDIGAAAPANTPIRVLSFPSFEQVESVLGQPVHKFQLLLDSSGAYGFERNWAPPTDRDERNIAYAVQWFALAVLAVSIAVGAAVRGYRKQPEPDS